MGLSVADAEAAGRYPEGGGGEPNRFIPGVLSAVSAAAERQMIASFGEIGTGANHKE